LWVFHKPAGIGAKMPLSDTTILNAKAKDKAYKLPDEKGMYLLVTQTGGKLWRLNYRFA
jgi:hypothetical protein